MAFALAGVPNAVATCGTALADEHFLTLKNLARKVTLAYDADAAGQAAAERCYQWEQRFEVQFQVADLPRRPRPGRRRGATIREALVERGEGRDAVPRVPHRPSARELPTCRTLEGRAHAARATRPPSIVEHPNDLVRDQYVMKLAGQLDIAPDRLRDAVATALAATARRAGRSPGRTATPIGAVVDRRELDALRWAVHAPELDERSTRRRPCSPIRSRGARSTRSTSWPWHECLEQASPEVAALLQRLAVEEPEDGVAADERGRDACRRQPGRSVKSTGCTRRC